MAPVSAQRVRLDMDILTSYAELSYITSSVAPVSAQRVRLDMDILTSYAELSYITSPVAPVSAQRVGYTAGLQLRRVKLHNLAGGSC